MVMGLTLREGVLSRMPAEAGSVTEADCVLRAGWASYGAPVIFGLLGASMDASLLSAPLVVGSFVVIVCGLAGRAVACWLCVRSHGWSTAEQLFGVVTWCPKATVQAREPQGAVQIGCLFTQLVRNLC